MVSKDAKSFVAIFMILTGLVSPILSFTAIPSAGCTDSQGDVQCVGPGLLIRLVFAAISGAVLAGGTYIMTTIHD